MPPSANNGINWQAIQEAARRLGGGQPSGAGIPGGMQSTNSPTPANPISNAGVTPMANPAMNLRQPTPPLTQQVAQSAVPGQAQALQNAQPDHATTIIKALVKTLDKLIPDANPPASSTGVGQALPLGVV